MISYAGVPLQVMPQDVALWVAVNVPVEDAFPFAPRYQGDPSLPGISYRPPLPPGPVRVGRFFYPWGASRFGVAYYVVDSDTLADIRDECYPDDTALEAQPLVLDSGDGLSIETDLWMLPPRPLAQVGEDPGLWLLTLVDERYWWWWKAATISAQTTWANLYSAIGTALGVSIDAAAVHADYLTPADWDQGAVYYPALPVFFDAVATAVGQRVVRQWDGTILTQSAAEARTSWEAEVETHAARLLAGGTLDI